jgi:hypothetical protein
LSHQTKIKILAGFLVSAAFLQLQSCKGFLEPFSRVYTLVELWFKISIKLWHSNRCSGKVSFVDQSTQHSVFVHIFPSAHPYSPKIKLQPCMVKTKLSVMLPLAANDSTAAVTIMLLVSPLRMMPEKLCHWCCHGITSPV